MEKEQRMIKKVAFFFDGTGNNRTNSEKDSEKYGGLTNINTLFETCTIADKYYIEGIGTLDNKNNSNYALATGENLPPFTGYSYMDKLNKAIKDLNKFKELNPHNQIELFIYGFSRGATLARDFGKRALASGPSTIRIKFLGIFDTVVSLAVQKPNIYISINEFNKIDHVLHLTAINEARKFFPLSSIAYQLAPTPLVQIQNLISDKAKEVFVPGAHADVGGGYIEADENVYLNSIRKSKDNLEKELSTIKTTVKDHFSGEIRFPIWNALLGNNISFSPVALKKYNMLSKRKKVPNEIATVYFEVMANCTNSSTNEFIFDYNSTITTDSLMQLRNDLTKYIKSNTPERGPNYDYVNLAKFTHISSNYGTVGYRRINELLNTFDPELLKLEIQHALEKYPMENLNALDEKAIYNTFAGDIIPVNMPNNAEWHRNVIYGEA